MEQHVASGLFVWDVELEGGAARSLLSYGVPTHFADGAVVSAVRRGPYAAGPIPTVDSLTPDTATVGDPDFTLQVIGEGFQDGDVILWNGAAVPTTFVSATELTTPIDMTPLVTPGAIPVAVQSLAGGVSDAVAFTLDAA